MCIKKYAGAEVGECILLQSSSILQYPVLDTDTAPDSVSVYQYTVILYFKYHTVLKFYQYTAM